MTIILVEDEPLLLLDLATELTEAGYSVLACANASIALRRMAEDHRTDLVITDIRMPGMDGLRLARHIKDERPGLPIIIVSAEADERASEVADATFVKPVDVGSLLKTMRTLGGYPAP